MILIQYIMNWLGLSLVRYKDILQIERNKVFKIAPGVYGKIINTSYNEVQSEFWADSHRKTYWYSHDHKKVVLIVEGSCEVHIKDKSGYIAKKSFYKGDVIEVHPFQYYRLVSISSKVKTHVTSFKPKWITAD